MEAKETDAIDFLEGYQEGKQAGIREVVEYVRSWKGGEVLFATTQGKAKLIDWGVDKPKK